MAALCVTLSIALNVKAPPAAANHAPCSSVEQTTFVYRAGSGQNSYGSMANIYSYDRGVVYCGAANTTFVRLGLTYDNFVETGLYYLPGDPTPRGFTEWAINGNVAQPDVSAQQFSLGTYSSFALSPIDSNYWKAEYDRSGNQSSWTVLRGTPALLTNHGVTESEVARFHGQNGAGSYAYLKYRPSTGGWLLWDALACDPNIVVNIDNWDAVKISNSQWYTRAGAPPAGDC